MNYSFPNTTRRRQSDYMYSFCFTVVGVDWKLHFLYSTRIFLATWKNALKSVSSEYGNCMRDEWPDLDASFVQLAVKRV